MIKGTSQGFKFKTPCNFDDIEVLRISFWQDDYYGPSSTRPLPIIKNKSQCFPDPDNSNELRVTLCPEETLRFSENRKAYVQLVVKPYSGESFASYETMFTVYPVYDDKTAGDIEEPTPVYGDVVILDGGNI